MQETQERFNAERLPSPKRRTKVLQVLASLALAAVATVALARPFADPPTATLILMVGLSLGLAIVAHELLHVLLFRVFGAKPQFRWGVLRLSVAAPGSSLTAAKYVLVLLLPSTAAFCSGVILLRCPSPWSIAGALTVLFTAVGSTHDWAVAVGVLRSRRGRWEDRFDGSYLVDPRTVTSQPEHGERQEA